MLLYIRKAVGSFNIPTLPWQFALLMRSHHHSTSVLAIKAKILFPIFLCSSVRHEL